METPADLSKMKVADLKKELKLRKLSVAGNKTELIERLQEAMEKAGSDGVVEAAEDGDGDEDFDEEEILGEEIDEEISPQEEEDALKDSIRVKDEASLLEPQTEQKKITLKRSQPPPLSSPTPAQPEGEEEEEEKEEEEEEEGAGDAPVPKKVIKLDGGNNKDIKSRAERFGLPLTEEAKKEARKERFNLASNGAKVENDEEKKVARAARFGLVTVGGTAMTKISMEGEKVEIDRLMKRAERFGEVTSPALLKVSEEEKKKARMKRFGEETTTTTTTTTTSTTTTTKKPLTPLSDEEEKKKKRAERFAI